MLEIPPWLEAEVTGDFVRAVPGRACQLSQSLRVQKKMPARKPEENIPAFCHQLQDAQRDRPTHDWFAKRLAALLVYLSRGISLTIRYYVSLAIGLGLLRCQQQCLHHVIHVHHRTPISRIGDWREPPSINGRDHA